MLRLPALPVKTAFQIRQETPLWSRQRKQTSNPLKIKNHSLYRQHSKYGILKPWSKASGFAIWEYRFYRYVVDI